jgi:hypothetical protein
MPITRSKRNSAPPALALRANVVVDGNTAVVQAQTVAAPRAAPQAPTVAPPRAPVQVLAAVKVQFRVTKLCENALKNIIISLTNFKFWLP